MHRVDRLDNCHSLLGKSKTRRSSEQSTEATTATESDDTTTTLTRSNSNGSNSDNDGHSVPLKHITVDPSALCNTTLCSNSTNEYGAASLALLEQDYKAALARIKELEEENAKLREQQVEIQAAKELYLKVFEDFPALIWRSGLDKMCDYFNRTWLEWTGKTMDQELGIGWANGVHPDDFDECLKIYTTAFDAHEPFCMEYRLTDKYGQYRWIRDHGRPFYDLDDTFLGYIGSCYDITENKNHEQHMVTLNKTKDKLVSLVSRDLRSPVEAVLNMTQFLQDNAGHIDASELGEITSQMLGDARRTLNMLENLRPRALTTSFKPQAIMSQDLFAELLSQVQLFAKAKKIRVQAGNRFGGRITDDDGDQQMGGVAQSTCQPENVMIVADKDMIVTVLWHLVMNSIKFTHPGGFIQLTAQKLDGETVLLSVADTGVGMSDSVRNKLFLAPSSPPQPRRGTGNELGSGMGLVLCRDYVERHNGNIWAEGTTGKETCIQMTLPSTMAPFKNKAREEDEML